MQRFRLTCVLLCLVVGCSSAKTFTQNSKPSKPSSIETQFEMARAHETDNQLAKAEAAYGKLCESQPNVARYHQRRGVVLTRLGQREAGLAELEKAYQLESSNTNILNDLGYAYLQSGETEKAVEHFRKTLALDARNTRANNNLALALGYDGDLKESFKIFQSTMSESDALTNLGYLATQNGQTDLAVKAYSRALTLEPDQKSAAEALTQLALMDRDLEQTRSIANDLSAAPSTPEEFPLNPDSIAKPKKVAVRQTASQTRATAPTKSDATSAKVLVSDRDE